MTTIHLEASQVPAALRGGYEGQKFKAVVTEAVTIPATAGLWDGGSRDDYTAIDLATGQRAELVYLNAAPWDGQRREATARLEPGKAVVRHSTFQGQDMGLTFYVHPANAAAMLPPPGDELTAHEAVVLIATRNLKASYGGRDRYQMACIDSMAYGELPKMTRAEWDATKAELIGKGLLNKAGAITPKGRNAMEGLGR